MLGEEGRYGEWERDGDHPPRGVRARPAAAASWRCPCPSATAAPGADDFRLNLVIGEECQRPAVGSFGLGITLHNDICLPYFLRLADEPQRERWLPGIVSGELITALAMTEPGIGSDLAGDDHHARSATATTTWSTAPRRSSPTASTPTS